MSAQTLLIVGFGAIGQGTLDLLLKLKIATPSNIIVIDESDHSQLINNKYCKQVRFYQKKINQENYKQIITSFIKKGDILIDLSIGMDSFDLVLFCQEQEIFYLNTCLECWQTSDVDIPICVRQDRIAILRSQTNQPQTTAILDHGMNPGLISHFLKQGLSDFCYDILRSKLSPELAHDLENALKAQDFSKMAFLADIKAIHISEKDSQIATYQEEDKTFYGTWSVIGFLDELKTPSEIGWGSHETHLPKNTKLLNLPHQLAILATSGRETIIRSWVPSGEIQGMAFRHGEVATLSRLLHHQNYQPSIYYSYQPAPESYLSINKYLRLHEAQETKILTKEIVSGADEVGCLLLSSSFGSWWTGSILTIEETRKHLPDHNATIMQVVIGVIAGYLWLKKNPRAGICFPEDLDYQEILNIAKPYLGKFVSEKVNWDYLKTIPDYQFQQFHITHSLI